MTAYHGGKQRIGKTLAGIILKEAFDLAEKRKIKISGYCEPFCGMLGVYQYILDSDFKDLNDLSFHAGDMNKSLIKMWKKSKPNQDWKPPTQKITKEEFLRLKVNGESSAEKGFIGHFYGYMGKYFQPFRHVTCDIEKVAKKILDIGKKMKKVNFKSGSYLNFSKLEKCIIYCDPPYEKQAHYYDEKGKRMTFNHSDFWEWCREMGKKNIVFVSEYQAPKRSDGTEDFKLVWTGKSRTPGSDGKEKLFVLNNI